MTTVTPSETGRLEDFDPRSGSRLERAVFNHPLLVLLLVITALPPPDRLRWSWLANMELPVMTYDELAELPRVRRSAGVEPLRPPGVLCSTS